MVAIQTTDYIMDVVSSMERQGIKFSLCFRRVLWLQGLRLDNELLVNVVYFQVNPVKLVFWQAGHSLFVWPEVGIEIWAPIIYGTYTKEIQMDITAVPFAPKYIFKCKCYDISPIEILTERRRCHMTLSWSLNTLRTYKSCYLSPSPIFLIFTCGCVICIQVLPDYMAGYLLATHARSFNDPQVNPAEVTFLF